MSKKQRLKELIPEEINPITGTKIESVIWSINEPDSGTFIEVETELGNFYFSKLAREIFLKEKKSDMVVVAIESCNLTRKFFKTLDEISDIKLSGRIIKTPQEFKNIGVPSEYTLILLKKHIKNLLKE